MIKSFLLCLIIFLYAWPAYADTGAPVKKNWDVTLGAGGQIAPLYEGSSGYRLEAIPYFNIVWKDIVALDTEGLDVYLLGNERLNAGMGLTYDVGRDQNNVRSLFYSRDHHHELRGLGSIGPSIGFKAFGNYNWRALEFTASVVQYAGDNNGLLADFTLARSWQKNRRWRFTPSVTAVWADNEYMQTYFGITPRQASHSQFDAFNAASGLINITLGINTFYQWNKHWFVSTDVNFEQLLGDAANSPISDTNHGLEITTVMGYHF